MCVKRECFIEPGIYVTVHIHDKEIIYNHNVMCSQNDMLRSEPEFDPSSKEINILERRDASIATYDC